MYIMSQNALHTKGATKAPVNNSTKTTSMANSIKSNNNTLDENHNKTQSANLVVKMLKFYLFILFICWIWIDFIIKLKILYRFCSFI